MLLGEWSTSQDISTPHDSNGNQDSNIEVPSGDKYLSNAILIIPDIAMFEIYITVNKRQEEEEEEVL